MEKLNKNKKNYFIPTIISLFFIASAKFYFLEIFGITKGVLYSLIFLALFDFILRFNYFKIILIKKEILTITLIVFVLSFILQNNIQWATLLFITLLFVSVILFSRKTTFDRIVKFLIVSLCFFSSLVVLQSMIYIIKPSLFDIPYMPERTGGIFKIEHSIHYLGWWTGGRVKLMGIELPRFRSFASEPSILVSIFYIPGLIGLTYKGLVRKMSYIIIIFAMILSSSGTIYLASAFGSIFFFIMLFSPKIVKKKYARKVFNTSFLLALIFITYQLITIDILSFMSILDENLKGFSDYSSMLGYAGNKSELRLISNQETFKMLLKNPFGFKKSSELTTVNLFLHYGTQLGFLGLLLCGMIYTQINKNLITLFNYKISLFQKIVVSLLSGGILCALIFTGYGWIAPSGFIATAIMHRRTQEMINDNENKNG